MRVSIEPFHLYRLSSRPDAELKRIFRDGLSVLTPMVNTLSQDHQITISILLDTSEFPHGTDTPQSAQHKVAIGDLAIRILELWRECSRNTSCDGQPIQIVAENRLAPYADHLLRHIRRSPELGEGSIDYERSRASGRAAYSDRFLKNYVSFDGISGSIDRDLTSDHGRLSSDVTPLLNLADLTQHAGIGIACELYSNLDHNDAESTRTYSCALLAATWQLYRLGYFSALDHIALPHEESPVLVGEHIVNDRTLTVLDPTFISVEHAVRLILRHFVDQTALSQEQGTILTRIAYFFVPPDWNLS